MPFIYRLVHIIILVYLVNHRIFNLQHGQVTLTAVWSGLTNAYPGTSALKEQKVSISDNSETLHPN